MPYKDPEYMKNWRKSHPNYGRTWSENHPDLMRGYFEKYERNHPGRTANRNHIQGISHPMAENKECPQFLGIYIGEQQIAKQILHKLFIDVVDMPNGNSGYDRLCDGFKIDVKCSCLLYRRDCSSAMWTFYIAKNIIADSFLCIGLSDRETLEPIHIWLIPGPKVNGNTRIGITNRPEILTKWSEYEKPIELCDEP